MSSQERRREDEGRLLTIRIAPEPAAELERLAHESSKAPSELAKEFLESELEAQHGLRHGPWLRNYMYR